MINEDMTGLFASLLGFDRYYNHLPYFIRKAILDFEFNIIKPRMKKFFRQFVKPGDLVFDVGASVGNLTHVYDSLGAKVISVEPQPACVLSLAKRFSDRNIIIEPVGVGQKPGKLKLYISSKNPTTTTFSKEFMGKSRHNHRKWDEQIDINVITLDSLIQKYGKPNFCKIDVEGFEAEVLAGLSEKVNYLSFEFSQEFIDHLSICLKLLESLGPAKFRYSLFQKYHIEPDSWINGADLIHKIRFSRIPYLQGDIYVKF